LFVLTLTAAITAASLRIVPALSTTEEQIDQNTTSAQQARANLQELFDELDQVVSLSRKLESSLHATVEGIAQSERGQQIISDGAVADMQQLLNDDSLSEERAVQTLNDLAETLRAGVRPLEDIRQAVALQEEILKSIPNKWPIVSNLGHVSFEFGPNIHPITNQWYLHKGIDIAYATSGLPVIASAAGRVVEAEYDQYGYGWNVVIEHKYGFKTRYAHLQRTLVEAGQHVESGERIGILGNTGTSTGPHIHFEVILGDDVLDPAAFLKITNEFRRYNRNRAANGGRS
jgi:murein DD-endopeptidase MepM/ murein hydrolase activator NlpD